MSAKKPAPASDFPASPAPPGEADYAAIHAAVLATERGRWFLAEYARRSRQADAAELLAAVERVGAASLGAAAQEASADLRRGEVDPERLRTELAEIGGTVARALTELSTVPEPGTEAKSLQPNVPPGHEVAPAIGMAAAAREIEELVWTMREQGFAADVCDRLGRHAAALQQASTLIDERWQRTALEVLADLAARVQAIVDRIGVTLLPKTAPAEPETAATPGAVEASEPLPDGPPATTTDAAAAPPNSEGRPSPSQAMNGPMATDADTQTAPSPATPPANADSGPPPPTAAEPAPASEGNPHSDTPQADEPARSAEVPQRAGSELSEDLFADVMALSEEERIALFT